MLCIGTETESCWYLEMQIFIFIRKIMKTKMILKNAMKSVLFLPWGEKKKKKWSFLILLTLLFLLTYSLGQSVPKGVRGQKASSFWFQGCDWKIGDKQMQNMANCKVKPLPKQSALVWELKLWYCFCYPARGLYVNILFCTVLGWFLTLWPRMVQMHFPLS